MGFKGLRNFRLFFLKIEMGDWSRVNEGGNIFLGYSGRKYIYFNDIFDNKIFIEMDVFDYSRG